jgi:succinate dehydrogenase / fumarate reductase iron-sulfur subunit/antitoxin CptB
VSERDRIQWHCRRGLLELDLVLQRFMARQFDGLAPAEVDAFKFLLEYEDNDLLDLVMRRAETVDHRIAAVLDMLRVA